MFHPNNEIKEKKTFFPIICLTWDHPYIMSTNGLGGWGQKGLFLMTVSTVFMLTYWVGGSEKV